MWSTKPRLCPLLKFSAFCCNWILLRSTLEIRWRPTSQWLSFCCLLLLISTVSFTRFQIDLCTNECTRLLEFQIDLLANANTQTELKYGKINIFWHLFSSQIIWVFFYLFLLSSRFFRLQVWRTLRSCNFWKVFLKRKFTRRLFNRLFLCRCLCQIWKWRGISKIARDSSK